MGYYITLAVVFVLFFLFWLFAVHQPIGVTIEAVLRLFR